MAEEAAKADEEAPNLWDEEIELLSNLSESSRTHVAFLGTAILARCVDARIDPFAVKAGADTPGAYSARRFGHQVLVPNAQELGINLGVTGREPLNNQPYFRLERVTEESILPLVRDQRPIPVLLRILSRLDATKSSDEAKAALRAFIRVRRKRQTVYPAANKTAYPITTAKIVAAVQQFVGEDSEGGKRAQAIAAGILDSTYGKGRVTTSRINDPDRRFPGDVAISGLSSPPQIDRVLEVRDKVVTAADVVLFAAKVATASITLAALLAAVDQKLLDLTTVRSTTEAMGVDVQVIYGWDAFVRSAIFWSGRDEGAALADMVERIRERLIEAEANVEAVNRWDILISP